MNKMNNTSRWALSGALAAILCIPAAPGASALKKIQLDDAGDVAVSVGFIAQAWGQITQRPSNGNGGADAAIDQNIILRRAELQLSLDVGEHFNFFLNTTGHGTAGLAGVDNGIAQNLLVAELTFKVMPQFQLMGGLTVPPTSRNSLTLGGSLLTMDYMGTNSKSLGWGMVVNSRFASTPVAATAGLGNDVVTAYGLPADANVTIYGEASVNPTTHLKYYVSILRGRTSLLGVARDEMPRLTGRLQLNIGDAENGYFNLGSYLGGKKTIAIGVSADFQPQLAVNAKGDDVTYMYISADVFAEQQAGPGVLTFEGAFSMLDLGGENGAPAGTPPAPSYLVKQIEGLGGYGQVAYLINNVQPWIAYETWIADEDVGTVNGIRAGLTYYFAGFQANAKLGYELMMGEKGAFGNGTDQDMLHTVILSGSMML